MATHATQAPKKSRNKKPKKPRYPSWRKGPRLWVEVSADEARKARMVAAYKDVTRGSILRQYSLNDVLKMYDELFGGKR